MVLVVSDGGAGVLRITKQLEIRDESYVVYFTNFLGAGRFGKGSVLVGNGMAVSLVSAIEKNRVTAVIDAIEEPKAKVSGVLASVCAGRVKYIKYANIEDSCGVRKCLSYKTLADMVRRSKGALMYASAATVSGIIEVGGGDIGDKMYVPIPKNVVFDTDAALEYSVPIINIIETEAVDGKESVKAMLERTGASMIICDVTVDVADKRVSAEALDIPIYITHNMGMEYPDAAAEARDAAMFVRLGK